MRKNLVISFFCICFAVISTAVFPSKTYSADSDKNKTITLPAPDKKGGLPLMEAFALRASDRNISDKALTEQDLSNLLWATWGVSREDGRHTAPTARNSQKIEVYAVLESGVWLYDGAKNELKLALDKDVRSKYSQAGVTLLYAAPSNDSYSPMHAGSLYQNAGLYCASAGLANVVRASGTNALKNELKLPSGYEIIITHSIGYKQ
jgi:hypothetical protein